MRRIIIWLKGLPSEVGYSAVTGTIGTLFLFAYGLIVPPNFWDRKFSFSFASTYLKAALTFGVLLALAFAAGMYSWRKLLKYVGYSGREKAMRANCEMIEKHLLDKSMELKSTRVTNWRISENSKERQRFRNILTDKISTGYTVKRLWQVKNRDDITQLKRYLAAYESFDNYSLKIIVSKKVLIPELLCIGDHAASISLPEPASPRELARCLHFFGKEEIEAVSRYFDVLWELAYPIKISNEIFLGNLERAIEQILSADGE